MLVNDQYYCYLDEGGTENDNKLNEVAVAANWWARKYPLESGETEPAVMVVLMAGGGQEYLINLSHSDARQLAKELLEVAGEG